MSDQEVEEQSTQTVWSIQTDSVVYTDSAIYINSTVYTDSAVYTDSVVYTEGKNITGEVILWIWETRRCCMTRKEQEGNWGVTWSERKYLSTRDGSWRESIQVHRARDKDTVPSPGLCVPSSTLFPLHSLNQFLELCFFVYNVGILMTVSRNWSQNVVWKRTSR